MGSATYLAPVKAQGRLEDGVSFQGIPKEPKEVWDTEPRAKMALKAKLLLLSHRSVDKLCLCNLMDGSTAGLPVLHYLLEFAQTQVHWVGDAIQPPHPLSLTAPPAPNPPQHEAKWCLCFLIHRVDWSLLPTIRANGDLKLYLQQAASSGCCG